MEKLLVLLFISLQVMAAKPLSSDHHDIVNDIFEQMKETTHQRLGHKKLKMNFYRLDNPQYYMESNFKVFNRLVLRKKDYKIGINPMIFEKGISEEALEGVMAHELVHTEDYENGKIGKVIRAYLGGKKAKWRYERGTDLRTVFKGYGNNLIEYKKFQYPLLTDKALKLKKKQYLTPEEIVFVEQCRHEVGVENDNALLKHFLKKVPLNLEEFKKSFKKFNDSINS